MKKFGSLLAALAIAGGIFAGPIGAVAGNMVGSTVSSIFSGGNAQDPSAYAATQQLVLPALLCGSQMASQNGQQIDPETLLFMAMSQGRIA